MSSYELGEQVTRFDSATGKLKLGRYTHAWKV
jgi:hypothetical protein